MVNNWDKQSVLNHIIIDISIMFSEWASQLKCFNCWYYSQQYELVVMGRLSFCCQCGAGGPCDELGCGG